MCDLVQRGRVSIGESIATVGRVVAIGDVFYAVTPDRVYRPPMIVDRALDIVREARRRQGCLECDRIYVGDHLERGVEMGWPLRPNMWPVEQDQLRNLQAPLKERYRTQPEAALVTLYAAGTLGEGVSCSVRTGRALTEAGLHPATGGDGSLLCSGDMLLEALVACAGVTLRAVATSLGISITSGSVRAEGDLDFRGTLGVDREAPVGFGAIRLLFVLDTDADEQQLATLQRLTERYCVVYQTLNGSPALSTTVTTRP